MTARPPRNSSGLLPALPEGSSRRRQRDAAEDRQEQSPQKKTRLELFELPEELHCKWDGACRGNGKRTAKSAVGVFIHSYDSGLSYGQKLTDVITNTGAEISGCAKLCRTAAENLKDLHAKGVRKMFMGGDSLNVVSTILSGLLFQYKSRPEYANSHLWVDLAMAHRALTDLANELGVTIEFHWIPRWLNKEPDELCNAVLDDRPVNTNIRSQPAAAVNLESLAQQVLRALSRRRIKLLRTLPDSLHEQLSIAMTAIAARYEVNLAFDLFLCIPILISTNVVTLNSRDAYKKLRFHLTLLPQPVYLAEQLRIALEGCTANQHPTHLRSESTAAERANDDEKRYTTMCKRGLHSKILGQKATQIADATDVRVQQLLDSLYPQAELPPRLPHEDHFVELSFNDVKRAITKCKRGTAPGLLGWTRELLMATLRVPSLALHAAFTSYFQRILNAQLTEYHMESLLTSILHAFLIEGKKMPRPVAVLDLLIRVTMRIGMSISGQSTSKQITECLTIIKEIQHLCDVGQHVVSADGTNAFNEVNRLPAFELFAANPAKYGPMYGILNMLYARLSHAKMFNHNGDCVHSIPVTTGTRQGCVSGSMFMEAATAKASEVIKQRIAPSRMFKYVDDVDIADADQKRSIDSFHTAANLFKEMCNLNIRGPKTHVISATPQNVYFAQYPASTAGKILGGVVVAKDFRDSDLRPYLQKLVDKQNDRMLRVESLPISIQNKLIMIRIAPWWVSYYLAAFPPAVTEGNFWTVIDELHFDAVRKALRGPPPFMEDIPANHAHIVTTPTEGGGLGILPLQLLASTLLNARFTTMHTFQQQLSREFHKLPQLFTQRSYNFNTAWPVNSLSTLSDQEVRTYWSIRFDQLQQPRSLTCQTAARDAPHFAHHLICCPTCSPTGFYTRHELVKTTVISTLKHFGVMARALTHKPLPGNEKGGPDFALWAPSLHEEVDVSICTEPLHAPTATSSTALNATAARKKRTYAEYSRTVTHAVSAFVMNTDGAFHEKTLERMEIWTRFSHNSNTFLASLYCQAQIAMIKGVNHAVAEFYYGPRSAQQQLYSSP